MLTAARRELHEEAHLVAQRWATLVDAYTTPGMSDERLRIFLATGLQEAPGPRHRGEGEERDMPVARFAVAELLEQVLAGRLHNPVLLLGLPLLVAVGGASEAGRLRPAAAPWQPSQ
jgi:ADP-ribose pyrophosphatase